ncbi:hypothetical protein GOV12_00520 [Candidatus Pacearchaeota archaeon]|nr:hypothetical protein [Candidatus Pacearchaeota archaeon]
MIELERTFLLKYFPSGLKECKTKEIYDIYIPKKSDHPKLRIRKNGGNFEITKKELVNEDDKSTAKEDTVLINEDEFNDLSMIDGKKLRKIRYYYDYNGRVCEIEVFLDDLLGLVMVEFEFDDSFEMKNFKIPDFCLADVTQTGLFPGGILCGKKYSDIEDDLDKFDYKKILLE